MEIRNYRPGDEEVQARIYNTAAGPLPAFKPATTLEVARRYPPGDPDAGSRFYALDGPDGAVVGYALFNPSGRVSYPWCLPGAEGARGLLLDAVLTALGDRGIAEATAAYRSDWSPVLDFFDGRGFRPARDMVNFLAEIADLPGTPVPKGVGFGPVGRDDLPRIVALGRSLIDGDDFGRLAASLWDNPWYGSESLFALRADGGRGPVAGAAVAVTRDGYADPARLDAAMPCFRLGAFGTERERHKRINGMVSFLFDDEATGEALLAEAARRLAAAGLVHAAAQAPTDRGDLIAFYERHFRRQGAFPILSLHLPT